MSATSRIGTFVAIVAIVAIMAGTWFLGISPRLGEIAAAESQREMVEAQNRTHEQTILRLQELEANRESLMADLDSIRQTIPDENQATDLMRELDVIAAESETVIKLVGFEGPFRYASTEGQLTDPEFQAAVGSVSPDNFATASVVLEIIGSEAGVFAAIEKLQTSKRFIFIHDVDWELEKLEAKITGQIFMLRDAADVPVAPTTPADTVAGSAEVPAQ